MTFVNRSLSAFQRDHNVYTEWSLAVLCTGSRGHSVIHTRSKSSSMAHRRKRAWPSFVQRLSWQFLLFTQWSRKMTLKSSESCKSEPHTGCHVSVNMLSNHALPSVLIVLVCRLANHMRRRQPRRPRDLLESPLAKYKSPFTAIIINIQHSCS